MKLWGRSGIALMTESLARLTPGTQDWDGMPPGGVPALTGAEMAGALAGLPRPQYLLARAAWVGDDSVRDELNRILLVKASNWFKPEDIAYPGMLRALCAAVLSQAIDPPLCRRCRGRGVIFHRGGRVTDCDLCGGSGKGVSGGDPLRQLLGLSTAHWRQIERGRQRLEMAAWGWKAQASSHIRRQLKKFTDTGI